MCLPSHLPITPATLGHAAMNPSAKVEKSIHANACKTTKTGPPPSTLKKSAEEPPPPEYADGSMIDRLEGNVGEMEHLMSSGGEQMPKDVYKRVWALVYEGRKFRRQQRRFGLLKAGRFVLKARQSLKWVYLQSACAKQV